MHFLPAAALQLKAALRQAHKWSGHVFSSGILKCVCGLYEHMSLYTSLRERTVRGFKSHLELLDDCRLTGSVSEADSAALWLNLYLAFAFFRHHVPARRQGRKTKGPRKALIRRGACRVEGQCGREIGQLHGKSKPSVTTFLLFHSSFPVSPPLRSSSVWSCYLAQHWWLLWVCVCLWMNVCVSLLVFVLLFVYEYMHTALSFFCRPFCHLCIQSPKHHFSLCRGPQQRAQRHLFSLNKNVRMRRGKAPASIFHPLLGCSCPWI